MSAVLNPSSDAPKIPAFILLVVVKHRYRCWKFEPRKRQALCGRNEVSDLDALVEAIAGLHDGRWPSGVLFCPTTRRTTLERLDTLLRRYGVVK